MVTPILTTKLKVPTLRPSLVPRARLIQRLDQGLHGRVTVVSAPAGFGKTTLLAAWLESVAACGPPYARAAWISLDESDNDPVRFAAYLSAALQQTSIDPYPDGADGLDSAHPFLREPLLVALINQVSGSSGQTVLILDDYHLITVQAIHDAVAFLVEHLPPNLHLILSTRADPPLPLPRLRARGELTELRQSDLRFDAQEASEFLNGVMRLGLSTEDVAALEARTEGWIAGLQMAALALQVHSEEPRTRSARVQAFTGSHRYVLDYLVEEVLDRQAPEIQEFLLRTSILQRMTGALCDRLLGEPGACMQGSGQVLAQLDAANLFILPLDDERLWYRYHRLFSDLLRRRLAQSAAGLVPELHRRASAWHEEQGLIGMAIEHALEAGDMDRAADLVEQSAQATLMRSEIMTFLYWVGRLPEDCVQRRPSLCYFHAWAWAMTGRSMDLVEQRLREIDCAQNSLQSSGAAEDGLGSGRKTALRAYLKLFQGDVPRAARLGQQALERLPDSDEFLRGVMAWILGLAQLAEMDLSEGIQELETLARLGKAIGNHMIEVTALCQQAKLLGRKGMLHQAAEVLDTALQLATDLQGQRLPIASEALIGLGELLYEWNDLEAAAQHLSDGIALAKEWSALAAFDAYLPLAQVRQAQGDARAAREALETARALAQSSEMTELDDLVADLAFAHLSMLQGDVQAARRWAEARSILPGMTAAPRVPTEDALAYVSGRLRKYEQLVVARLLVRQGQPHQALELLDSLLVESRRLGRVDLEIEVQIQRALGLQAAADEQRALEALGQALDLAQPGGHVRIFLDEGEPLTELLRQSTRAQTSQTYAHVLLATSQEPALSVAGPTRGVAQPLVEPLSDREREVLRLLATGMSNPDIAEKLVIAVSTVRSHCKSIYTKLDVHSRWDAAQRGRELGLI